MTRTRRLLVTGASVLAAVSLFAAGCSLGGNDKADAKASSAASVQNQSQAETGAVVSALVGTVGGRYHPKDSAELRNLNERLKRWESPNKIGYISLLANDGTLVWYGTIKGKPSSLNSHISNDQDRECSGTDGTGCTTRPSPDLDGSFGDNPQGIFFFDSSNIYHEWIGLYFLSDAPSKTTQQPKVQIEANATPTPNS